MTSRIQNNNIEKFKYKILTRFWVSASRPPALKSKKRIDKKHAPHIPTKGEMMRPWRSSPAPTKLYRIQNRGKNSTPNWRFTIPIITISVHRLTQVAYPAPVFRSQKISENKMQILSSAIKKDRSHALPIPIT